MKVDLLSGSIRVYFRHVVDEYTHAIIKDKYNELIGYGIAYCNPGDQFTYAKGRQIALDRALDNDEFSREDRRCIWEQYWKDHRDLDRQRIKLQKKLVRNPTIHTHVSNLGSE